MRAQQGKLDDGWSCSSLTDSILNVSSLTHSLAHKIFYSFLNFILFNAAAITEVEQIMSLPEFSFSLSSKSSGNSTGTEADIQRTASSTASGGGGNYADSLRLTEDDRVNVYVTYASLLSKGWMDIHFGLENIYILQ